MQRLQLTPMLFSAVLAIAFCSAPGSDLICQSARIDSLRRVVSTRKLDSSEVYAFIALCNEIGTRDSKQALGAGERAVAIARRLNAHGLLTRARFALASTLLALKRPREAEEQFMLALQSAEKVDAWGQMVNILWRLGRIAQEAMSYEKAASLFERTIVAAGRANQPSWVAESRNRLGIIHATMGHHDLARVQWQRALKDFDSLGNRARSAGVLCNLAASYANHGLYDTAAALFQESIRLQEALGDAPGVALGLYNVAELFLLRSRFDSARVMFERSAAIYEHLGDTASVAETLNRIGVVWKKMNNPEQALSVYQRSLQLSERTRNTRVTALTLNGIGEVQMALGRLEQARDSFRRTYSLMEQIGDRDGAAAAMNSIGSLDSREGRYDDAISDWERSVMLYDQMGKLDGKALALTNIGIMHRTRNRNDSALAVFERCLRLYETMGNKQGIAELTNCIAGVYREQGRYERAMDLYIRCLRLCEEYELPQGIATQLNDIGILYRRMGNKEKALEYYQRALRLQEELEDKTRVANVMRNIGIVLREMGRDDAALGYYTRALHIADRLGDRSLSNSLLFSIATIHSDQGRDAQALDLYTQTLRVSEQLGEKVHAALALQGIADVHLKQQNVASALDVALKGMAIARETGDVSLMQSGYRQLGEISLKRLDFARAYEYSTAAAALKDSLVNVANLKSINEMQEKYQAEQRERTIALLEKEKQLQSLELEAKRKELVVQKLETVRNRQRAELLAQEQQIQRMELGQRTSELELRTKQLALQRAEKETISREKMYESSNASRERSLRNALLAALALFLISGVLGVKRVQAKRTEAMLRAEAAEYKARSAEAESLRVAVEAERRGKEFQHGFSQRLIASQEQERRRIAIDLHDGIGQDVLVIQNRAAVALRRGVMDEETRRQLEEITRTATATMKEVRDVSRQLRPAILERAGLSETLRTVLAGIDAATEIRFDVSIDDLDGAFPRDDEINVFRIVQESVTNVLKHSHARHASITVRRTDAAVDIAVCDDGDGIPAHVMQPSSIPTGLGMQGIQERITMMHGDWRVASDVHTGTSIFIHLPARSAQ